MHEGWKDFIVSTTKFIIFLRLESSKSSALLGVSSYVQKDHMRKKLKAPQRGSIKCTKSIIWIEIAQSLPIESETCVLKRNFPVSKMFDTYYFIYLKRSADTALKKKVTNKLLGKIIFMPWHVVPAIFTKSYRNKHLLFTFLGKENLAELYSEAEMNKSKWAKNARCPKTILLVMKVGLKNFKSTRFLGIWEWRYQRFLNDLVVSCYEQQKKHVEGWYRTISKE